MVSSTSNVFFFPGAGSNCKVHVRQGRPTQPFLFLWCFGPPLSFLRHVFEITHFVFLSASFLSFICTEFLVFHFNKWAHSKGQKFIRYHHRIHYHVTGITEKLRICPIKVFNSEWACTYSEWACTYLWPISLWLVTYSAWLDALLNGTWDFPLQDSNTQPSNPKAKPPNLNKISVLKM